jgi:hypothetical protein
MATTAGFVVFLSPSNKLTRKASNYSTTFPSMTGSIHYSLLILSLHTEKSMHVTYSLNKP